MSAAEPALFRAFPALHSRLPRCALVGEPTPAEPLPLEGVPAGKLFVKRDERSCPLYGGNKPRKLEFVIGHALARRCRRLVTAGGLGTHHGLATAILGRAAGLATTVVLVDQPVTDEVRETLLLQAAWGADLVYSPGVAGAGLRTLGVLATARLRGERPCLVLPGGSTARGNLGFVSAGLELSEQVRAGLLPEPAEIFAPAGTGGTCAGLVVGLKLAGLDTRVRGVLVTDILARSPRRLARSARAALRLLRRLAPETPDLELGVEDFALIRDQVGPGYGAPTPEAVAAVRAAAECGIRLETTYTGKCLAALRARARRGELPRGPVLFWNTFNAIDARSGAPASATPDQLPGRLRHLLGLSAWETAPPPSASSDRPASARRHCSSAWSRRSNAGDCASA